MSPSLRLLLIDDDEIDRRAVVRALHNNVLSFEVITAATAHEGLKLALEQNFDAILLDYRLPDQDGISVLQSLRCGEVKGVAVVMLSRHEDESLAERCLEAGAQDFLLKDEVNGRRLSRAIRQARQRYHMEEALNRSREQLRELSIQDPLTGLLNRRGFEAVLGGAVARACRENDCLAVLLLDLDDFKSINDTLGHHAGDTLLIEIAQRLRTVVRDSDYLCRLGGDEFVVLMTPLEHNEQAVLLADRIISVLQAPILLGVSEQTITASIGIATYGADADTPGSLLKFADVAMYQAKQAGRNQSQYYSATLQALMQHRVGLKRDLSMALEKGEFRIFYQAQICARSGELGGVEALLRWQHPKHGLLAPSAFMDIAEETGLIVDIGNWVLREGCRQLKSWQENFPARCPRMAIAINLSAIQIRQNALPLAVGNALAEYALDPDRLELEITESALIEDAHGTAATLDLIAQQGVTLALDDFGTGYSSLDHLKLFPISILKIDRGFVSSIGMDAKSERLLVAIIAFAKALEMKVIAEGIESRAQADFCIRQGCDLLQGYHFSRPVSADKFEAVFLKGQETKMPKLERACD